MSTRASQFRLYVERAWRVAGAVSVLLSLGFGTAVSAVLASLVNMTSPWRWFFFAGVLLTVAALSMPAAGWSLLKIGSVFAQPAPANPESPAVAEARRVERQNESERRRKRRVAAHKALSVLEVHRADLELYRRAQSPEYQGDWNEVRALLAEEPLYDSAIQVTERALNGVRHLGGQPAQRLVLIAIAELTDALNSDRDRHA